MWENHRHIRSLGRFLYHSHSFTPFNLHKRTLKLLPSRMQARVVHTRPLRLSQPVWDYVQRKRITTRLLNAVLRIAKQQLYTTIITYMMDVNRLAKNTTTIHCCWRQQEEKCEPHTQTQVLYFNYDVQMLAHPSLEFSHFSLSLQLARFIFLESATRWAECKTNGNALKNGKTSDQL